MRHPPLGFYGLIMDWITALLIILFVAAMIWGCAPRVETPLHRENREVQDCILSGGTAHAGPNGTIECAF
jgi:hypothetical protein